MGKNYAKTPVVYQMEAAECGAAALSSVLRYFGKTVLPEQLRVDTGTSLRGCSAGELLRASEKYGLECHGYKTTVQELRTLPVPCILHWNYDHFVVFEGFKGKYAFINDPASGKYKLTYDELSDGFSGVVLTFRPGKDFKKDGQADNGSERSAGGGRSQNSSVSVAGRYVSIPMLATGLTAIGFMLALTGLAILACTQIFIDNTLSGNTENHVNRLLLAVIAAAAVIIRVVIISFRGRILYRARKKIVIPGIRDMLAVLFRLPISFYEKRYAGELAGRIDDIENAADFAVGRPALIATDVASSLIYLVAFFIYSPELALIALLAAALTVLSQICADRIAAPDHARLRRDGAKLAGTVFSGLAVTDTLKANGAENDYVSKIISDNASFRSTLNRRLPLRKLLAAVPDLIRVITVAALLSAGCALTVSGRITAGMLAALILLFIMLIRPLCGVASLAGHAGRMRIDRERIDDIMMRNVDRRFAAERGKHKIDSKLNGSVSLKNVTFGYAQGGKPVLKSVNLSLECGSSTGITGNSGSGKTTLAKVIAGLYAPWSGSVSYSGNDPARIPGEVFTASVTFAARRPDLFSGTIRDNIRMWNPNVSESDVVAAAKDACIHEFITGKPGAYDFCLSEGASNISTGQKQRIGIARALAVNPTLLIMDEATSAVDAATERRILENIRRRGCTLVVISKNEETLKNLDRTVTLSEGRMLDNSESAGAPDDAERKDGAL